MNAAEGDGELSFCLECKGEKTQTCTGSCLGFAAAWKTALPFAAASSGASAGSAASPAAQRRCAFYLSSPGAGRLPVLRSVPWVLPGFFYTPLPFPRIMIDCYFILEIPWAAARRLPTGEKNLPSPSRCVCTAGTKAEEAEEKTFGHGHMWPR